jgi:hypothetical protein
MVAIAGSQRCLRIIDETDERKLELTLNPRVLTATTGFNSALQSAIRPACGVSVQKKGIPSQGAFEDELNRFPSTG